MAKTELKIDAANLALRTAAIVGVVYGIGFLLMREFLRSLNEPFLRLGWTCIKRPVSGHKEGQYPRQRLRLEATPFCARWKPMAGQNVLT